MKKEILIAILLFCVSISYSQKICVTKTGLTNFEDKSKSYVVIEFEGKTAKELYENTIKYIHRNYKNPEHVIRGNIKNEFLSFATHKSMVTKMANLYKSSLDANYTTTIDFKDGKIKIEFIELELYFYADNKKIQVTIPNISLSTPSIYKKNGEMRGNAYQEMSMDIHNYFNNQLNSIEDFLSNTSEVEERSDDW